MLLRLWCVSLLTFFLASAQTSKLDPSLIGASGQVPVMVVLADQPHGAIASQAYASFAPQLRALEQSLRNLPDSSPLRDSLLSQLDRLHAQIRGSIKSQIGVRVGSTQLAAQSRMGLLGASRVRRFNLANLLSARIPATALASLQNDADVAYVFRDRQISMNLDVSTQALGAQAFWNAPLNITGVGVKVGIIDTGVNANHLALAGVVTDQNVFHVAALAAPIAESLYADDGTLNDNQGHGTHVAGIVASRGTAGAPTIRGVARGASIVNLKAGYLTSSGGGSMYFSDFFDAVDWGYFTANVSIFNYSFGGATAGEDPVENQILDNMVKTYGLFFAVAAGNSGTVNVPGYAYNTTQVGAMDDKNTVGTGDDTVATFSSIGPTPGGRSKPDLAAPGVNIVSLDKNGTGFVSLSGTSMATPHIAGAAALLWQAGITDPLQIKALLIHSPGTTGWTNNKGWGYTNLVNAAAQLPLVSTGTIPAAANRLYKVTNAAGTMKATMVWDRSFTNVGGSNVSNFNNLDMVLYSRSGNTVQGVVSPSALNNVEQVSTGYTGGFVLRISSPATLAGGIASQDYGFVLTPAAAAATLTLASGPNVSISCVTPAGAQMNVALQLSCTATNSGDLEAFSVQAAVTQPSGWSAASNLNFGILSPATSKTLAWTLTPRTFGASVTLPVALTGTAFGSNLAASTSVTFGVLPPVYNISGRITLNSSSGPGVQGVTMTLTGGASASTLTDANGNYAFNGLPSGLAYTVTPTKSATKFSSLSYSTAALNANASASFTATSIITISGRITDSATGLGVANVSVKTLGTISVSAVTNANGDYSLLNVSQGGNYSVIPTPPTNTKLDRAKLVYLQTQTLADLTGVNFVLSNISNVPNNESSTATQVPALPAYIVQAVALATVNTADPQPSCAFERGNDSVWYQYTANFTGTLDLSTFGSNYDTLIAAYSGATPTVANEIGCNDDYAGSLYSKLYLPVVSGQTYRFVVSGANSSTSTSTLVLTVSRAN